MKKTILTLIVLIIVGFSTYMIQKNDSIHSEAVFVATDSLTNLAFKIDGKIDKMTKKAGDKIQKGEVLATLETNILNTKLKQIKYKIKSQIYKLQSLSIKKQKLINELNLKKEISQNNLKQLNLKIMVLKYQIKANKSKLSKLGFDKNKFYKLYKDNKISYDKYKKIDSEYSYLSNIIKAQSENIKVLELSKSSSSKQILLVENEFKNIDILDEQIETLFNQVNALKSEKQTVLIKIKDSLLKAPFSGIIAKKFVNTSSVIKKGSFIYSVVNPKDIYIKVLLSERKLSNVKIGSQAVITLDSFDENFDGKVVKIMPVSASTFSLVPRDIASGEFTKLDQRFIVKIRLNRYYPQMRIGMGGEVKIYKDK